MTESMIDHMTLHTDDLAGMESFYGSALAPLGMSVLMRVGKELTGRADILAGR